MKNLKKLNRKDLQHVNGAAGGSCNGCPLNATYGDGPGFTASCATYWALPEHCRMCVLVHMDCFEQIELSK